jgi:hypothetical protein
MSYGIPDAPLMNSDKAHISQAMPLIMALEAVTLQQRQEAGLSLAKCHFRDGQAWKAIGIWVRGILLLTVASRLKDLRILRAQSGFPSNVLAAGRGLKMDANRRRFCSFRRICCA